MPKMPKIKELSFLVYGLGLTGLSVVKFLKKNKIKNFKVWDDNKKKLLKNYRANNLTKTLHQVDYIVLAPGISLNKNIKLQKFKNKIITDIDLFYLTNNKFKSIVVTGTNGKSTTCKLLAHLLKKNKLTVSLGGNIGTPVLDLKISKKDYVIIEASSFQLSHSQFIQPNFSIFLNLTNDHLEWHGNMNNYLNSKLKIFKYQLKNHYAIVNKKFKKIFIKKKFSSKLLFPEIKKYKQIKFRIKNNYLSNSINDENMAFILALAKLLKINEKSFIHSMNSFKGLPHRFETFFKRKELIFINDSKATSFTATQLALSSLKNIYWILGGIPKKGDKITLSNFKSNIIKCYLIGKNINFFKKQVRGKINFSITKNLEKSIIKILNDCKMNKKTNKYILLSPAAASFDQFNNFEDRGNKFKRLCKLYARKYN
jgi:UDP-N-acetylmuramoylalanine--D-glutamate ligase